ncbi:MAG: hypothetical protein ABI772_11395 [Bacteroidota bacterium]
MRKNILFILILLSITTVKVIGQAADAEIFDQVAILNPAKEVKENVADEKNLSPESKSALLKTSFRLKDPAAIDFIKISLGSANNKKEYGDSEISISKQEDKYYYSSAAGAVEAKYNLINWSTPVSLSNYTTARFVTVELHHVNSSEVTMYYIPVH